MSTTGIIRFGRITVSERQLPALSTLVMLMLGHETSKMVRLFGIRLVRLEVNQSQLRFRKCEPDSLMGCGPLSLRSKATTETSIRIRTHGRRRPGCCLAELDPQLPLRGRVTVQVGAPTKLLRSGSDIVFRRAAMAGDESGGIDPPARVVTVAGANERCGELAHLKVQVGPIFSAGRSHRCDLLAAPHMLPRLNQYGVDVRVIELHEFPDAVFFVGMQHNDDVAPARPCLGTSQAQIRYARQITRDPTFAPKLSRKR